MVSTHAPQYTTNKDFVRRGTCCAPARFFAPTLLFSLAHSSAAPPHQYKFNECFTHTYEALFLRYRVDFVFSGHSAPRCRC